MELIDKAAVVEEIERARNQEVQWMDRQGYTEYHQGLRDGYANIISFLATLEVKEVDLDFQRFAKEMEYVFALPSSKTKNTEEEPLNWEYAIAKHFFEIGLKAQK